jgi:hypothetical protein
MLVRVSSEGTSWASRNLLVLTAFAPLLVLTGVLGFVLPAELSLMSGAPPYDVFHLVAGGVGLVLVARRSASEATSFNLIFGGIDLYQALAGVLGWFPANLFALRPADHVVHVIVGGFLLGVGVLGRRSS